MVTFIILGRKRILFRYLYSALATLIFRLKVETGGDNTAITMLNKWLAAFHAKRNNDGHLRTA